MHKGKVREGVSHKERQPEEEEEAVCDGGDDGEGRRDGEKWGNARCCCEIRLARFDSPSVSLTAASPTSIAKLTKLLHLGGANLPRVVASSLRVLRWRGAARVAEDHGCLVVAGRGRKIRKSEMVKNNRRPRSSS